MDGTFYAWIIITFFFLVYSMIQLKKCLNASDSSEIPQESRIYENDDPPIYAISENNVYTHNNTNSQTNHPMSELHTVSEPDIICGLYRLAIISEKKNKVHLPTYDEVMAEENERTQMTSQDANTVLGSTISADSTVVIANDRPSEARSPAS